MSSADIIQKSYGSALSVSVPSRTTSKNKGMVSKKHQGDICQVSHKFEFDALLIPSNWWNYQVQKKIVSNCHLYIFLVI